jgi:hypothetical protein
MGRLTQRCSTIYISIGDKTRVYHSVDEIPVRLRERLIETTQGVNSATILIADKDGREQILNAVQKRESIHGGRVGNAISGVFGKWDLPQLTWSGLGRMLVLGGLGYILWLLIALR